MGVRATHARADVARSRAAPRADVRLSGAPNASASLTSNRVAGKGARFPASIQTGFTRLMANTPQAKKRIRRNDRRAEINGARVGRIRTFVKKVELALTAGDKSEAVAALAAAQPEMARGVAKGVLHKNTAARKFSRLTKRVAALG